MTHWPYILGAYAMALGTVLVFAVAAWRRLCNARRRLAAVDPRLARGSAR